MTDMEFGVTLWNVGDADYTNPETFRQVALTAEEYSFDSVWAGEHVIIPDDIPAEYPFTPDGEAPMDISQSTYDVFDILAHIAGMTDEINIGTNVAVVPYRHPVILAKHVLTHQALYPGRFEFGAAPGWLETEFEVLDVPFEERGQRLDEFFELFDRIYEEKELSFDGEFHSFQKAGFHPVPDEQPPIWLGGNSGAAIRRIAEYGDGWSTYWAKPDDVASMKERIMNAWRDYDREGEPEIAVARPVHVGTDTERSTDRPLVGEPESILEDIETYADVGTTRLILTTYDTSTEAQLEQIQRFGKEIIPQI